MLPRMRVSYRRRCSRRWTCARSCARRPELCLIDELAHTNAPGVEHGKRYEDVEEVLAAGIDVLSTLNVQHLESLNDQITELSGIRVRETIPDAILGRADEVVLIDLTPEALLDRLRAGKIYPAERIDAALNNFFRIENLSALREVALRQVAEEVGAKRLTTELVGSREESLAADAPQAVGERLLALVEPYPGSQRLVRRAWRSAQRLGAELDLLWVRSAGPAARRGRRALARGASAARLGARRQAARGGVRRRRRRRRRRRPPAGHDLHPAGPLAAGAWPRAPARAAAAAADAAAARRRRADRRRPRPGARTVRGRERSSSIVVIAACGAALGIAAGYWLPPHGRLARRDRPRPVRRILLPFTGEAISRRSFEAAVRLAKAEHATVMPAFLATVPMNLPLETPLPVQCARRHAAARGDRAERRRAGRPGRLADRRAGAPRAMRCADCSSGSSSTGSSSRPMKTRTRASATTTSDGCSSARPPRS